MKHKPEEYKHIRAWGRQSGSFDYYIVNQQHEAAEDNAPVNAIFKKSDGTNDWVTADEIQNNVTRASIELAVERMG